MNGREEVLRLYTELSVQVACDGQQNWACNEKEYAEFEEEHKKRVAEFARLLGEIA